MNSSYSVDKILRNDCEWGYAANYPFTYFPNSRYCKSHKTSRKKLLHALGALQSHFNTINSCTSEDSEDDVDIQLHILDEKGTGYFYDR